jgi:hypothetical protein
MLYRDKVAPDSKNQFLLRRVIMNDLLSSISSKYQFAFRKEGYNHEQQGDNIRNRIKDPGSAYLR